MTDSEPMQIQSSISAASELGKQIGLLPGVLLLLGLVVLFGGTGNMQVFWIEFNFAQNSPAYVGPIATGLGTVICLFALYAIFRNYLVDDEKMFARWIFVILGSFVLLIVTLFTSWRPTPDYVHEWGYNPVRKEYWVNVQLSEMAAIDGTPLILAVRRKDSAENIWLMDYSMNKTWSPSMREIKMSVTCEVSGKSALLGDIMEWYLFSAPVDVSTEPCLTLDDLKDLGCRQLEYSWLRVAIKEATPTQLQFGIDQLNEADRSQIIEHMTKPSPKSAD